MRARDHPAPPQRRGAIHAQEEELIQLKRKIRLALEAVNDKKADDPVALNLKGIASFTDSFLICGGAQRRQTQAICDAVVEALGEAGVTPGHIEGYTLGDWILIDFADLVVHIFTRETRGFYNLERLWGDAPRVVLDSPKSRKESEASAILKG